MENSDSNWNSALRLVPMCPATEPKGNRSPLLHLLLRGFTRVVSTSISGGFSGVGTKPSNLTVRREMGPGKEKVGGGRKKACSTQLISDSCLGALWCQKEQREHLSLLAPPLLAVVSQWIEATWCLVTEGVTHRWAERVFRVPLLTCHISASMMNHWVQTGPWVGAKLSARGSLHEWHMWKCSCLSSIQDVWHSLPEVWKLSVYYRVTLLFVVKGLLATQSLRSIADLTLAIGFPYHGFNQKCKQIIPMCPETSFSFFYLQSSEVAHRPSAEERRDIDVLIITMLKGWRWRCPDGYPLL